jgi:ribosomal-protein-alanine N-acetyltransferase
MHPDLRRQGYGRRLLNALLFKVQDASAQSVFLEVRPSNHAAMQLYLSAGFREIGIRPAYYQAHDGRENAIVLALTLASSR